MSHFNQPAQGTRTINLAGGGAFSETPELELLSIMLTSFVTDQYYRSDNATLDRLQQLIHINDKYFVAQSALYARNVFGMRSISHAAAVMLMPYTKELLTNGHGWAKQFYDKVVHRPDDMTEILSLYFECRKFKRWGIDFPLLNSVKKGFAMAIGRFDEYRLAKYRIEGKEVTLIDAVNLVHPKPNSKNSIALAKLMDGKLTSEDTWETMLTRAGQNAATPEMKAALKAQAWGELLQNNKIGYFALLRNLRNILQQAPEVLELACNKLVNKDAIHGSLVLPFRFTTAFEEIERLTGKGVRLIMDALNKAIDISLENVPQFDGDTLVAVDVSGSMSGRPAEIASLFAAILAKANDADVIRFNEVAKYYNINKADSVITISRPLKYASGGTNFHNIFYALERKYDRIIILSDMQGWMGVDTPNIAFNEYKKKFGADPIVYSFDLSGYGTLQLPQRNIYCMAGFSDKVFDIMKFLESDKDALINEIKKVVI